MIYLNGHIQNRFSLEDLKNEFKLAFIPNMINFYDITGEE